jgi:energy-coupling factor transporter ATP-binding protein EcfA2
MHWNCKGEKALDKRIHIITGHYGSGKSEIAVNMALAMKDRKVVFADLDIINPYFRSNEARNMLEEKGITVMTTKYANTNVDIPALTGDLSRYLLDKGATIIMDVGGDDAGAKVVGRYRSEIPEAEAAVYFVLNFFRPETRTVEGAMTALEEIQAAGRMKVDYIINNSHLMEFTTEEDILQGKAFAEQVSRTTGIPIAFHAILQTTPTSSKLQFVEPVFRMEKTMGLARHLK